MSKPARFYKNETTENAIREYAEKASLLVNRHKVIQGLRHFLLSSVTKTGVVSGYFVDAVITILKDNQITFFNKYVTSEEVSNAVLVSVHTYLNSDEYDTKTKNYKDNMMFYKESINKNYDAIASASNSNDTSVSTDNDTVTESKSGMSKEEMEEIMQEVSEPGMSKEMSKEEINQLLQEVSQELDALQPPTSPDRSLININQKKTITEIEKISLEENADKIKNMTEEFSADLFHSINRNDPLSDIKERLDSLILGVRQLVGSKSADVYMLNMLYEGVIHSFFITYGSKFFKNKGIQPETTVNNMLMTYKKLGLFENIPQEKVIEQCHEIVRTYNIQQNTPNTVRYADVKKYFNRYDVYDEAIYDSLETVPNFQTPAKQSNMDDDNNLFDKLSPLSPIDIENDFKTPEKTYTGTSTNLEEFLVASEARIAERVESIQRGFASNVTVNNAGVEESKNAPSDNVADPLVPSIDPPIEPPSADGLPRHHYGGSAGYLPPAHAAPDADPVLNPPADADPDAEQNPFENADPHGAPNQGAYMPYEGGGGGGGAPVVDDPEEKQPENNDRYSHYGLKPVEFKSHEEDEYGNEMAVTQTQYDNVDNQMTDDDIANLKQEEFVIHQLPPQYNWNRKDVGNAALGREPHLGAIEYYTGMTPVKDIGNDTIFAKNENNVMTVKPKDPPPSSNLPVSQSFHLNNSPFLEYDGKTYWTPIHRNAALYFLRAKHYDMAIKSFKNGTVDSPLFRNREPGVLYRLSVQIHARLRNFLNLNPSLLYNLNSKENMKAEHLELLLYLDALQLYSNTTQGEYSNSASSDFFNGGLRDTINKIVSSIVPGAVPPTDPPPPAAKSIKRTAEFMSSFGSDAKELDPSRNSVYYNAKRPNVSSTIVSFVPNFPGIQ